MASPFANAQIDFSILAGLPNIYAKGKEWRQQQDMRDAFAGGLPMRDGAIDYDAAWSKLAQHDPVSALKGAAYNQYGRGGASVYGTPIWGTDEFGNEGVGVIGKDGSFQMLDTGGFQPSRGLAFPDLNNVVQPTSKSTGLPAAPPMPKTGSLPPGYEPGQSGGVTPMPGSPQHRESVTTVAADKAIAAGIEDTFSMIERNARGFVDEQGRPTEALKAITGEIAGAVPKAWLPNVSRGARDASAKMENLGVQIGLAALAKMREASATGASGMGQLAIQESLWLQNSIASLQQAQTPEQAAKHLQEIIQWSRRIREIVSNKYREIHGSQGSVPTQSVTDGILDYNEYFGR